MSFTVIINGQQKTTDAAELPYLGVVRLAYDGNAPSGANIEFTTSYRNGPPENPGGTLVSGQSVKLKDRMVFNVTATDKS